MMITAKIKLLTTDEQYRQLWDTMQTFNQACNWISDKVFEQKIFSKVAIQKAIYYDIREAYPTLSSQMVIRAIAKVAEAYKKHKKTKCTFKPDGAIVYDQRILSFKGIDAASLLTTSGRTTVAMTVSGYHQTVMQDKRVRGQADLVLINYVFYLYLVVEIPDGTPIDTTDVLGIDLGIVRIATDSDGQFFSGKGVTNIRNRNARLRGKLQAKGTKSAKRKLKKRSLIESRMARDVNHCIAKKIVDKAKRHSLTIALEDLGGMRKRKEKSNTATKAHRQRLNQWSFYQLRQFIEYKAKIAGIPVVLVDPRYTSQMCSSCGHTDKKNRKSQDRFCCTTCGFALNADYNASLNIQRRAIVNSPIVGI